MRVFLRKKRIFYSKQGKIIRTVKGLNFFDKLFYFVNLLCALLLVLASTASMITWEALSFLSFLSLGVPYLVIVNLCFFVYWFLKWKRQFRLSFIVLVIGFLIHGSFFKFFGSNEASTPNDVSVISLNSHELRGTNYGKLSEYGSQVYTFISAQNSDIICFQEFDAKETKRYKEYPYTYVNYIFGKEQRMVQAILSKYPIINKGALDFPKSSNNAIFADVVIRQDTIRVYNVHLESFNVRPHNIQNEEPKRLFGRLNASFQKQQRQAELLREHKESTSYKSLICGDFNNTQFSSVYNTIKGDMNDAFLEKGSGLGNTYDFKFLPFRIDFIFTDESMDVQSFRSFKVRLSDHEPVMASFSLQE